MTDCVIDNPLETVMIKMTVYQCAACGHPWIEREYRKGKLPGICEGCKRPVAKICTEDEYRGLQRRY